MNLTSIDEMNDELTIDELFETMESAGMIYRTTKEIREIRDRMTYSDELKNHGSARNETYLEIYADMNSRINIAERTFHNRKELEKIIAKLQNEGIEV